MEFKEGDASSVPKASVSNICDDTPGCDIPPHLKGDYMGIDEFFNLIDHENESEDSSDEYDVMMDALRFDRRKLYTDFKKSVGTLIDEKLNKKSICSYGGSLHLESDLPRNLHSRYQDNAGLNGLEEYFTSSILPKNIIEHKKKGFHDETDDPCPHCSRKNLSEYSIRGDMDSDLGDSAYGSSSNAGDSTSSACSSISSKIESDRGYSSSSLSMSRKCTSKHRLIDKDKAGIDILRHYCHRRRLCKEVNVTCKAVSVANSNKCCSDAKAKEKLESGAAEDGDNVNNTMESEATCSEKRDDCCKTSSLPSPENMSSDDSIFCLSENSESSGRTSKSSNLSSNESESCPYKSKSTSSNESISKSSNESKSNSCNESKSVSSCEPKSASSSESGERSEFLSNSSEDSRSTSSSVDVKEQDGSTSSGGNSQLKRKRGGGKIGRKRKRGYIYNPKPLMQKEKNILHSVSEKDTEYWIRRQRNNEAAKRSRECRRIKEIETIQSAKTLEIKNIELKDKIRELEQKNKYLEFLLCKEKL